MNRNYGIGIGILSLLLLSTVWEGCSSLMYAPTGQNQFVNKEYGFLIDLPAGWKYSEDFSRRALPEKVKQKEHSHLFAFYAPDSEIKDPYFLQLTIIVKPIDYRTKKDKWINDLREMTMAYKGREYFWEDISLPNVSGLRYVGSTTYPGSSKIFAVFDSVIIWSEKREYSIRFVVPEEYFQRYKGDFDRSVKSFRVLN